MAIKASPPDFKVSYTEESIELGHAEWKRGKIAVALEQAKDRDSLVPAE